MTPGVGGGARFPAAPRGLFRPGQWSPHQFSLLMWSPKPGVSMTVSFMRTPFSSISVHNHSPHRVQGGDSGPVHITAPHRPGCLTHPAPKRPSCSAPRVMPGRCQCTAVKPPAHAFWWKTQLSPGGSDQGLQGSWRASLTPRPPPPHSESQHAQRCCPEGPDSVPCPQTPPGSHRV